MKKNLFNIIFHGMFILFVFLTSLYACTFMLLGKSKVTISYGDEYKDSGYIANFLSISLNKYVKVKNNVDTSKLGSYKVIYELPFFLF